MATATYVNATTFTVVDNYVSIFDVGRRVKCDCGADGLKYGTVESRSYSAPNTTIVLTAASDDLTNGLVTVLVGEVGVGTDQSTPVHPHDGTEGSGGLINHSDLTDNEATKHRLINDSGSGSTDLWSAEQIEDRVVTATGTLTTDHGALNGLADDDHTQYHNDTRGDARYYTETELDAGQLDNRYYREAEVDTISGSLNDKLNTHKTDDDHTQYSRVDGTRDFSGTVGGIDPVVDADLSTKKYVDDEIVTLSGSIVLDHGGLTGLADDDHTQYSLADGTRAFTGTVGGITPEADADLTTKAYVDDATTVSGHTEFGQEAIGDGVSTVSPTFAGNFDDATYALQVTVKNTDDSPAGEYSYTITTKSVSGFTVTLSDNADSANYVLEWFATDSTTGAGGAITNYQDFGAILTVNGTYRGDTMLVQVDDASSVFGSALYCAADFHYERADADSDTTMPVIYLALQAGSGVKRVLIEGQICNTTWNWSAGLVYASTTTGGLTQTAPTGSGDQIQIVGHAISADTMFFNPDFGLVENV